MDLEATPAQRRQLEYATQHFDFTPDSLTDTITIFAMENLEAVLNGMRDHCIKAFAKKVPENEMRDSFALLQEKYTSSTEKVLEEFGTYIQKHILTVPPHVVLPEDREHFKNASGSGGGAAAASDRGVKMADDLKKFDLSCQNSRGVRYKLAVMEARMANLKRVRDAQKAVVKQAELLDECEQQIDSVVDEESRKLDKKLDKLRSILAQLEDNDVFSEKGDDSEKKRDVDRKRKLADVEKVSDVFAKRFRQDSAASGSCDSGIENEISCANSCSIATAVNCSSVSNAAVKISEEKQPTA